MIKKVKHLLLIGLVFSTSVLAYTPSESAEISILTTSSGKEIYKIYGHSAIRFQDKEQKKDIVYNYGMFSFGAPHFMLRYLQGQNYYLLGKESFQRFNRRYDRGGETVSQQTLNLNYEETKTLLEALEKNALPKNREYLYNVIYDNCATRVHEIVDDNLAGGVIWDMACPEATFRALLHSCNYIMPFSQMGIDIVFGPKADRNANCMEQMFLPEKLMMGFANAKKSNGEPLVKENITLLKGRKIHTNNEIILFNVILTSLLIFSLLARFKKPILLRGLRIAIYSLVGLLSLVVCFIAFFSIHPTVWPNPNLIWINPLWLFFAGLIIINKNPKPIFQKILNSWSILMAVYLIVGIAGVFYLHYGLIYLISTLLILSYKRLS
ncbi:MAG: DUF4105 domain-containing protein [Bacteroidales bacterium]|jgi:hypothetical protein|nr:DUF4105 domain-containing protein [Bacteroidales bacterium]